MATTVYYNFPEITVNLTGKKCDNKIQLTRGGQPTTNIQLNNVNYSANYIYITGTGSNANEPTHLVVECFEDIFDTTSHKIYVVFPFVVDMDVNHKLSDIDNIIEPPAGTTTVKLNLNNHINKKGQCVVPSSTTFPLTITLDSESAISIKQYISKTCYTLGNIPGLELNSDPDKNKNAKLQQQDLDWIMSCELLTDDGPTDKKQVDPGSTATVISLFLMTILIAGTTHITSPILYREFGMQRLATEVLDNNHYSIKVYWGINLIIVGLLCIIQGSNNSVFFFIGISLILSFFSGASAMAKVEGVGDSDKTEIKYDESQSVFAVYSEILMGKCATFTGRLLRWGTALTLVFSFIVMFGSILAGSGSAFISFLIFYFILVIVLLRVILYTNAISK